MLPSPVVAARGRPMPFSQRAVFLLVPIFAVLAGHRGAFHSGRGDRFGPGRETWDQEPDATGRSADPRRLRQPCSNPGPLLIFGLCVMLFHLANAALLPLVGQKLAAAFPKEATAMMSACIVAAQAIMLPIALLVGRTADSWGRKAFVPSRVRQSCPSERRCIPSPTTAFWLIGVQFA